MNNSPDLKVFNRVPKGFCSASASELFSLLGGPCVIHLSGRRPTPLFVSVLLHGNEDTGFEAIKCLLQKYHNKELPRALSVFVGNVSAAAQGLRRLDDQPDYNRVWPGGDLTATKEGKMVASLVKTMAARKVFAAIDVHNNTGLNPHYACVNRLDKRHFHFATLFSRTVVYFIRPKGAASTAMAELCPAVTIECGQPGAANSVSHALEFIDAALHLAEHPVHEMAEHDMDLFHNVAIVKVPDAVRFHFGDGEADIHFHKDIDHLNFRELPIGVSFARISNDCGPPLQVWDEQGDDLFNQYFKIVDGELCTQRVVMPSMLTLDERVIRQDCVCYLMERVAHTRWQNRCHEPIDRKAEQ